MKFIKLLVFLCAFNQLWAQEQYATKNIHSVQELESVLTYTVAFDRNGYTWLATDNGIYKFNGTYYKHFSMKDGLPTNDIFYIKIDSEDRIWLTGYFKGLYYIKNDQIFKVENANIQSAYYEFTKQDTLFFSEHLKNGRYFLTNQHFKIKRYPDKENLVLVNYHHALKAYVFKNAATNEYYLLNDQKKVLKKFVSNEQYYSLLSNPFSINFVNIPKNKQENYSVTKKFPFEIHKFTFQKSQPIFAGIAGFNSKRVQLLSAKNDDVYKIYSNSKGKCIVFEKGIYNEVLSQKISSLPYNFETIESISIDKYENFWIIFKGNTVQFIPKSFFKIKQYSYNQLLGDHNYHIKSAFLYEHSLIALTSTNEVFQIDFKNKSKKLHTFNDNTSAIYRSGNQLIAVQTNKIASYKIQDNLLEFLSFQDRLIPHKRTGGIRNSYFKKDNIYTIQKNIIQNNTSKNLYEIKADLRFNNILVTDNQSVVVSNEEQLGIYHLNSKQFVASYSIKFTNTINHINDLILVGTHSNGLLLVTQKFKILQNLLPNDNIYKIIKDSVSNQLFVVTNAGLYVYNYNNKKFHLTRIIPLDSGIIKGKINDILSDSKNLYIITQQGITTIAKDFINIKISGEIEINHIIVNDHKINNLESIFLKRDQNNISIQTSLKTMNNTADFVKYYSLSRNNQPEDWKIFTENQLFFKELAPGTYTFKTYSQSYNDKTKNSKSFQFTIKPYFWETTFFKILVFIAVILLTILGLYIIRSKRAKKFNLRLKLINLEMKALRAQMNPHFIFNTLNNMQSSVLLDDEIKVNNYFAKFAKLLRSTLDIVNKEHITLADEMAYINSYIAIENMKTNQPINLTYTIDESIDTTTTKVPVMLLQPFVENAVIHGLSDINDDKQLKITIKKQTDAIIIAITDNGVGRNVNKNIDHSTLHTSYATKIVQNRLQLYKDLFKKEFSCEIVDLVDANNQPLGTKVILNIAIIDSFNVHNIFK